MQVLNVQSSACAGAPTRTVDVIVNQTNITDAIHKSLLSCIHKHREVNEDSEVDFKEDVRCVVHNYVAFMSQHDNAHEGYYRLCLSLMKRCTTYQQICDIEAFFPKIVGVIAGAEQYAQHDYLGLDMQRLGRFKNRIYDGLKIQHKHALAMRSSEQRMLYLEDCVSRARYCCGDKDELRNKIIESIIAESISQKDGERSRKWMLELDRCGGSVRKCLNDDIIDFMRIESGKTHLYIHELWRDKEQLRDARKILTFGLKAATTDRLRDKLEIELEAIALGYEKIVEEERAMAFRDPDELSAQDLAKSVRGKIELLPQTMRSAYRDAAMLTISRCVSRKNINDSATAVDDLSWLKRFESLLDAMIAGSAETKGVPSRQVVEAELDKRINHFCRDVAGQSHAIQALKYDALSVLGGKTKVFDKPKFIVLNGPYGCGKSKIAYAMASAIHGDVSRVGLLNVAAADQSNNISGSSAVYMHADVSVITSAMIKAKNSRVVFVINEAEKGTVKNQNLIASLLEGDTEILDPYLKVPLDLSGCYFILTANDKHVGNEFGFLPHLATRLKMFTVEFRPLVESQVKSLIRRKLRDGFDGDIETKDIKVSEECIDEILADGTLYGEDGRLNKFDMRNVANSVDKILGFIVNHGKGYLLDKRRLLDGADINFVQKGSSVRYASTDVDTSIFDIKIAYDGPDFYGNREMLHKITVRDPRQRRSTDLKFQIFQDRIQIIGNILEAPRPCSFSFLPVTSDEKVNPPTQVQQWPIDLEKPVEIPCGKSFWQTREKNYSNIQLSGDDVAKNFVFRFAVKMTWSPIQFA